MIKFDSARFGELEVDEGRVINFPDGLIGLSNCRRFILIDHRDSALKWLQCLDDPEVALLVVPPSLITAEFELDVNAAVRGVLELDNEEDLAVLVTLRVSGDDVIANFQGPILISGGNMRGVQVVYEGARKIETNLSSIS